MKLLPYLHFDGNCREAVTFYAEVFQTEPPKFLCFSDSGSTGEGDGGWPMPEEAKDRIMHTELTVAGGRMMFSDTFPGAPYVSGNQVTIAVMLSDKTQARRIFDGLKKGGEVIMELQETHWSGCYGFLTDRFSIGWQISVE